MFSYIYDGAFPKNGFQPLTIITKKKNTSQMSDRTLNTLLAVVHNCADWKKHEGLKFYYRQVAFILLRLKLEMSGTIILSCLKHQLINLGQKNWICYQLCQKTIIFSEETIKQCSNNYTLTLRHGRIYCNYSFYINDQI